jgi:hypothetical protein
VEDVEEPCCRREKTDTCTLAAIVALAEEGTLMPTDPETGLVLAAAAQRLANWTGSAMPPSPAAVATIARRLELAAHAEVERAIRRVREEGQGWAVVASLLGLDCLPCHVDDPARLAFDYCAGLAWPPEFDRPRELGFPGLAGCCF